MRRRPDTKWFFSDPDPDPVINFARQDPDPQRCQSISESWCAGLRCGIRWEINIPTSVSPDFPLVEQVNLATTLSEWLPYLWLGLWSMESSMAREATIHLLAPRLGSISSREKRTSSVSPFSKYSKIWTSSIQYRTEYIFCYLKKLKKVANK